MLTLLLVLTMLGAIQDGPDIQPPKIVDDLREDGPSLQFCPSSNSTCMKCYTHAARINCDLCDYLNDAYYDSNGVLHCVWYTLPALKHYR